MSANPLHFLYVQSTVKHFLIVGIIITKLNLHICHLEPLLLVFASDMLNRFYFSYKILLFILRPLNVSCWYSYFENKHPGNGCLPWQVLCLCTFCSPWTLLFSWSNIPKTGCSVPWSKLRIVTLLGWQVVFLFPWWNLSF